MPCSSSPKSSAATPAGGGAGPPVNSENSFSNTLSAHQRDEPDEPHLGAGRDDDHLVE